MEVCTEVKKAYKKLGNWRAVGREFGVSGGMAYRIAVDGYEPKEARIRVRLGLAAMVPAPACRVCGEVHVSRRCVKLTTVTRRARSLFDLPVKELRRMLEEREEL
jgi:hypothetical protein